MRATRRKKSTYAPDQARGSPLQRLLMHPTAVSTQTKETTFWIPPDCPSRPRRMRGEINARTARNEQNLVLCRSYSVVFCRFGATTFHCSQLDLRLLSARCARQGI